jgi:hypothetical protein
MVKEFNRNGKGIPMECQRNLTGMVKEFKRNINGIVKINYNSKRMLKY